MMKIVIIEDEHLAARRLENLIHEYDSSIEIVTNLESVADSIAWFRENQTPDLVFLDIHLEDNVSFAIFEQVSIPCPVIFTTATDQESTKIFLEEKIDFLLKPIIYKELVKMLDRIRNHPGETYPVIGPDTFKDMFNRP